MSQLLTWAHAPLPPSGGVFGVEPYGHVRNAQIGGISNALLQDGRIWPSTHAQTQPASARVEEIATMPITVNPTKRLRMITSSEQVYL